MAPARDTSPVSEEFIPTEQGIQDTRGGLTTSSHNEGFWPNSNITAVDATPQIEVCSSATDDASSPGSRDTDAILERMTYVGGMNYAKYRLEASRTKCFGKHKKVRPSMLCMQDELSGGNAPSMSDGATSVAFSRRSSAYRAVEDAAAARTIMFEAEAGAQRALARLADTRAECNEQHKVVTGSQHQV